MNADLLKGFRTLLVNLIGIVFVYIHNRYPEIPIPGGVATDAMAMAIINILLRFITNTPIGKKTPGEETKNLGTSGCVANLWPILALLFLCVGAITGFAMLQACAFSGGLNEEKLIGARIISRHAGHYVKNSNPELAEEIRKVYSDIAKVEGESYQKGVHRLLSDLLTREGVQDSGVLLADAKDLLALFGVPFPRAPGEVTLDWIKEFDVPAVREVAGAFMEGVDG